MEEFIYSKLAGRYPVTLHEYVQVTASLAIAVNGFQPLAIVTKSSMIDVAVVLNPLLNFFN